MKYLLLALPLAVAACAPGYDGGYAQGYNQYPAYSSRNAYNEDYDRGYGYAGGPYSQYPAYSSRNTYNEDYNRGYGYAGGSYSQYPAYSSRNAYNQGYSDQPYYGGENCGTPDEPKACPPLPRHPLTYYPGDRD